MVLDIESEIRINAHPVLACYVKQRLPIVNADLKIGCTAQMARQVVQPPGGMPPDRRVDRFPDTLEV